MSVRVSVVFANVCVYVAFDCVCPNGKLESVKMETFMGFFFFFLFRGTKIIITINSR